MELRNPVDSSILVGARPALLTRSGKVVDLDGVSPIRFSEVPIGDYHVQVRHRNHLPVMTLQPVSLTTLLFPLDFATGINATEQDTINGRYTLIVGDTNGNHSIDAADRSNAWNSRNQTNYLKADVNLDGVVNASDRSIIWNNRNKFRPLIINN